MKSLPEATIVNTKKKKKKNFLYIPIFLKLNTLQYIKDKDDLVFSLRFRLFSCRFFFRATFNQLPECLAVNLDSLMLEFV